MQVRQTEIADLLKALGLDAVVSSDRADLARRVNKKPGISRLMDEGQVIKDPALNLLYERIVQDQAGGNLIEVIPDDSEPETFPLVDREGLTDAGTGAESGDDSPPPQEPSGATTKKKGKKMSATATKTRAPAKKPAEKTKGEAKTPAKKPAAKAKASANGTGKSHYEGFSSFKEWVDHLAKHPKTIPAAGAFRDSYDLLVKAGSAGKPITKEKILDALVKKYGEDRRSKMKNSLDTNLASRFRWMYAVEVTRERLKDGSYGYSVKSGKHVKKG